tara:strand:+ start:417 stop:698 length:282 start_codon:yes stop_codon:yes gene_type:complete
MLGDRFIKYPLCRNSRIYFISYTFFTTINIIWLYLIINNHRGYIHFQINDPTIKFILSVAFLIITGIIARCGCLRDVQPAEDTLSNTLVYNEI